MPIPDKFAEQLLEGCCSPEDILGESGLLKQLTRKVAERALETEMEDHPGYPGHEPSGKNSGNFRHGKSRKSVRSVHGEMELELPRDHNGTFEPKFVRKGEKPLQGCDDRVISLYARGMTTSDIQAHFQDAYGVEVPPTFISQVSSAVMDEVTAWQNRPLDTVYPIVYLDVLVVRSRDSGMVQNKAVYLALGINMDGEKELQWWHGAAAWPKLCVSGASMRWPTRRWRSPAVSECSVLSRCSCCFWFGRTAQISHASTCLLWRIRRSISPARPAFVMSER